MGTQSSKIVPQLKESCDETGDCEAVTEESFLYCALHHLDFDRTLDQVVEDNS